MLLPLRHALRQGPVIASLGGTALAAARQQLAPSVATMPSLPGPEINATLPPRHPELVRDYLLHVGGDPGAYRGVVPPHLFPQWGFPLAARTLRGLPYPLAKVLNGGCRLEVNAPLRADRSLRVSARLEDIDDDGRRAVLHQRVVTGTDEAPEAVVAHLYAIVPLAKKGQGSGDAKAKASPRVPHDATELAYWRLASDAGLRFAMLTGDFNPVHWSRRYARAAGFRDTILHGFSTMARAMEGLHRALFAGDTRRIAVFDVKFTRPLVLPARVGLYLRGDEVYVGDAPDGPAYLVGSYTPRA